MSPEAQFEGSSETKPNLAKYMCAGAAIKKLRYSEKTEEIGPNAVATIILASDGVIKDPEKVWEVIEKVLVEEKAKEENRMYLC